MKKIIILILISLFSTVYGQDNSPDYSVVFSTENLLIDVRTPQEFHSGHLKKAVSIQYNKIDAEIKYFAPDKEQTIVVYCQSGRRSDIAAKKLKNLGYRNVINAGKYKDLKALEEKLN